MRDDHHHPMTATTNPPEDIDLGAIKTEVEFIMERLWKLPTRQEQALKPLYTMVGSATIVITWIELFRHVCL